MSAVEIEAIIAALDWAEQRGWRLCAPRATYNAALEVSHVFEPVAVTPLELARAALNIEPPEEPAPRIASSLPHLPAWRVHCLTARGEPHTFDTRAKTEREARARALAHYEARGYVEMSIIWSKEVR